MRRPQAASSKPSAASRRAPASTAAEPALDHRLLFGEAAAAPAQALHRREQAQQGQAESAVRADLERYREGVAAARHAGTVPAAQTPRPTIAAGAPRIGDARLEVVDDGDDVAVARPLPRARTRAKREARSSGRRRGQCRRRPSRAPGSAQISRVVHGWPWAFAVGSPARSAAEHMGEALEVEARVGPRPGSRRARAQPSARMVLQIAREGGESAAD